MVQKCTVDPSGCARKVLDVRGAAGAAWLERLPQLVADCAERWYLDVLPPFAPLSYNYVAPVVRADGSPAVLKAGVPHPELRREIDALRCFAGRGIVRLLEADPEQGVMLLERLLPGQALAGLGDEDAAARVAAGLMRDLWRPAPPCHDFDTVSGWAGDLHKLHKTFRENSTVAPLGKGGKGDAAVAPLGKGGRGDSALAPLHKDDGEKAALAPLPKGGRGDSSSLSPNPGYGPFPPALVDRAQAIFSTYLSGGEEAVLIHGDLHAGNILSSQRGWLLIDPKGVVGDRRFDAANYLIDLPDDAPPALQTVLLARRCAVLSEMLGYARRELLEWSLAEAVLRGWWSYEDHGRGWEGAFALAALIQSMLESSA